jgi:protein SCO1
MITRHNQERSRKSWLVLYGVCCLFFALNLAIPWGIAGGEEQAEIAGKDSGETYEGSDDQNKIVDEEWISEKTGKYIPLDTVFTDSAGQTMPLRAIIDKPTLILPIYFYCPNICSPNLAYVANAIKNSTFKAGVDFKVISFSFNGEEKVEDAENAKENYLKMLPDNFPSENWKFLVGTNESIKALIGSLGYRVKRMPDGTFVHPSALVALSAEGRIIKYIYGSFLSGDVDMALLEAKKGTPALSVKRLVGFCFNTDSKKSNTILQKMKIGLMLVFLVLGGLFIYFLRRRGKERTAGVSISKIWIGAGVFCVVGLIVAVTAFLVVRKPAWDIDVPGARGLSPPVRVPPFSLIDQRGQTFNNDSLTGNWTLAVIGFTYCPDVCPMALREMSVLFKQFDRPPGKTKAPRFVFFSVDPFRDSPKELGEYVGYFNKNFLGVTGKPENINKLVTGLGLFYTYQDPQGVFIKDVLHKPVMDDYVVVHYSGLLFITPRGELVATLQAPLKTDDVLAVLRKLRASYGD